MSQLSPRRAATAAGLALGTVALGVALAPAAVAAPAASVSATTVAPGATFTVSGTECVSEDPDNAAVGVFAPVQGMSANIAEPGADGSWTMTQTAPTEAGTYEYDVWCDWYTDGFDYANITITVAGPAAAPAAPTAAPVDAIRGASANTKGIVANRATDATSDRLAAPGEKVVRVYRGFQPYEVVRLTLHSTPQNVGTFTADAAGVVTATFTVPAGTPVGTHTFVLVGDKGSYFQESFEVAAVGDARLADTGASIALPLGLGLGALAVGGGLVVAARRSAGASQA